VLNDRYLLLMLLGKGGFSEVHKAELQQQRQQPSNSNSSNIPPLRPPWECNSHRRRRHSTPIMGARWPT